LATAGGGAAALECRISGTFPALHGGAVFGNVRATFGRDRSRLGAAAAGAFGPARFINRGFIT
jgi:hypothetical protein